MPVRDVVSDAWSKLTRPPATLGVGNGVLYLASRVLVRASAGTVRLLRYRIVAQPIGNAALGGLRADSRTVVRPCAVDSPLVAAFPRPPQVIARRYANGAECFTAVVRDTFAGFIWFQRGAYDEDEVRCRYVLDDARRSVWDFDVHVESPYRLGRTLARLWQAVDAHLATQGVQWSFSRISAFNAASIAAHARLGIVDCGSATFLCIGPLQLSLLSMRPFMHLSWSSRQRPSIRLSPPREGLRKPGCPAP
ncbi:MAG TPA: hypothetical protein VFQ20_10980 [Burkholderiaceae bacterium]|nr:hypothetical protein [Burkholderiaceae bacterium]